MEKRKRDEWTPSEDATKTALMFLTMLVLVVIAGTVVEFGIFIVGLIRVNPEISQRIAEIIFSVAVASSVFIIWKGRKHIFSDEK